MSLRHKNALFLLLGLVTAIPTILPAVAASATSIRPGWQEFVLLLGFLGNAHVGMTFFLSLNPATGRSCETTCCVISGCLAYAWAAR